MHALRLCLIALMTASSGIALAQFKPAPKGVPSGPETRYFTSIDGLMDGNADVVLKETRQGKTVTAAVLDVCYPAEKGSARKDRFVVDLAVDGATLSGATKSLADQLPVTVKLTRRPTGDSFEFKGQIGVGATTTNVVSVDNTDLSEREFQDTQSTDDGILASPKDFTEVSPESIALKVRLEAASDFLKTLRGQNLEIAPGSLTVTCDALRSGQQPIYLTVDPERAAAFVAKAKTAPGVMSVGWSSGVIEMDRTIRFSAADWRDGDKLNRDKLATAIGNVIATSLSARLATSKWNDNTGKLKLTFKRPSQVFATLDLTETMEVTALVSPDRPGATDKLMLWVSGPTTAPVDESTGAKLTFAAAGSVGEDESDQKSDLATVDALAREFKGQRWDADRSAWK